jgi:hypothetical protein
MSVHNWTRVEAGIFHDFHHAWIEEIKRVLNSGLLPEDYYALAEQFAAGFGPDVLALEETRVDGSARASDPAPGNGDTSLMLLPPKVQVTAETDMEFYRRKQKSVTIRHVSGDHIVAMVEVVSPGNKGSRNAFRSFVEKAAELLNRQIHLLILDLLPPGRRDPLGIHAAIWEEITGQQVSVPPDKPLTLASYESGLGVRAFVVPFAVGEELTDMPLFLKPGAHVPVPLENTYSSAYAAVPRRWQRVLESSAPPT